jgi:hypothetical protein
VKSSEDVDVYSDTAALGRMRPVATLPAKPAACIAVARDDNAPIDGGGSSLDGEGERRGFLIQSGNLTIQNLTMADNAAIGGAGLTSDGGGAGQQREAWRSA